MKLRKEAKRRYRYPRQAKTDGGHSRVGRMKCRRGGNRYWGQRQQRERLDHRRLAFA